MIRFHKPIDWFLLHLFSKGRGFPNPKPSICNFLSYLYAQCSASKLPILPVASATSLWGCELLAPRWGAVRYSACFERKKHVLNTWNLWPFFCKFRPCFEGATTFKNRGHYLASRHFCTLRMWWSNAWMGSLQTPFLHLEHCTCKHQFSGEKLPTTGPLRDGP